MPHIEDINPVNDSMEAVYPKCSLPEIFAFVEDFEKESKKFNIQKTHSMSLSEAQNILSQNLHFMSLLRRSGVRRGEPQAALTDTLAEKEDEEKPESMTDLLHHSLLSGSLTVVHKLRKSQERLLQSGIPPPAYMFPYNILIDYSNSLARAALRKKVQSTLKLCKLGIFNTVQEKFTIEHTVPKYFLINPEKQFMDLKDLEWRYYKGIVKWTHTTSDSFMNIKYNEEKRYVESQQMSALFPPLVRIFQRR